MSDHYQRIGRVLLEQIGTTATKLMLYAEVDEGATSADVFFMHAAGEPVQFRFGSRVIHDELASLWEGGTDNVAPRSWKALRYIIDGGKFAVELTYHDQLARGEGLPERRADALVRTFPGQRVDYTRANG